MPIGPRGSSWFVVVAAAILAPCLLTKSGPQEVYCESDPGRVSVVIKRFPSLQSQSSFSRHVYRNRVHKAPVYENAKYKYRHKYFNHKEYLRSLEKRKSRIIYHPFRVRPTPAPYKESLNIDQPDSPYGLIHKLFSLENNEILETKKEEIPQDLDPEEVWLSDGNLLVLKVGTLRTQREDYKDKKLRVNSQEEQDSRPSKRIHYINKRTRVVSAPRKRRRIAIEKRRELFE